MKNINEKLGVADNENIKNPLFIEEEEKCAFVHYIIITRELSLSDPKSMGITQLLAALDLIHWWRSQSITNDRGLDLVVYYG